MFEAEISRIVASWIQYMRKTSHDIMCKYFSKSWSTASALKHQTITRTLHCLGVLAFSVNVLSIQRSVECVSWIWWRHVCPFKMFRLLWLYYWTFDLPQFPRQSSTLKFVTTLLTTLLNRFWRLVRRSLISEHPLNVPQNHQQPIIPTNNTIRMMLYKTLTQMMMLLWEIKCTTMRTMPCKGGIIILTCGLNILSTGSIFWQTPHTMTIMKTPGNNCKQFMRNYSTSTPSNIFENQHP